MILPNFNLLPNYYTKSFDGKITNIPNTQYPFVPYIKSYYEYIDLNEDKEMIKRVTKYFYDELMNNWIKNDNNFKKFNSKKMLKTKDGIQLVYKILYKLVKKGDTKWWDLKDPQYILTKDFMFYQLNKFFNSQQNKNIY